MNPNLTDHTRQLTHFSGVDQEHQFRCKATQPGGRVFRGRTGIDDKDRVKVPREAGLCQSTRDQYSGGVIRAYFAELSTVAGTFARDWATSSSFP